MKEVKPSKKPLAIYYAIVLLVLLVINLVVMPWLAERQVQEVDYGTFMSMTEQENIGKVDIQSNQIIFTDKDNKQIYKTGLMNDPGLTERLYDAGAQFSSEIVEQGSPVLSFLLWFVLPILLFSFIGNQMNKKLMEQRIKSSVDVLTGVFSRLAYHECLEQYADSVPADLTVFLMDINGLKGVNDALGHEARDELICGAAQCITQAVGDRGKIFRIGGDEFVVLGQMTQTQAQEILAALQRIAAAWSGTNVGTLSISSGCAFADDHPDFSVEQLTKAADLSMYAQKQEYYRAKKLSSGTPVSSGNGVRP